MEGLLRQKRHSLTHTWDNLKLKDLRDTEIIHGAKDFGDFLPDLMKDVVSVGVKNSKFVFRICFFFY